MCPSVVYDVPVIQYRMFFPMAEQFVTGETLVGEIVTQYPEAIEILRSTGMHCLGCPASRSESLQDACAVHGIPAEQVIDAINERIAEGK